MTDYTDIAEQLYKLMRQEKEIKSQMAFLKDQLKENLEDGEVAQAGNGYQYKVTKSTKNTYAEDAIEYIANETQALKVFASVSDTSIKKAKKAGLMSAMDAAMLEGMAIIVETSRVQEVAPKVETVLPVGGVA